MFFPQLKHQKLRAATSALVVVSAVLVITVLGVVGYGAYRVIQNTHTNSSTTQLQATGITGSVVSSSQINSATSVVIVTSSTNTSTLYSSSESSIIESSTSVYSTGGVYTSTSPSLLTSNSVQSSSGTISTTSSITQSVSVSGSWPFILTFSPTVGQINNVYLLNVTYTSTLSVGMNVREEGSVQSSSYKASIGSSNVTVSAGAQVPFLIPLGALSSGTYSVTFYLTDYSSGQQVSESESIPFTVT